MKKETLISTNKLYCLNILCFSVQPLADLLPPTKSYSRNLKKKSFTTKYIKFTIQLNATQKQLYHNLPQWLFIQRKSKISEVVSR